MSARAIREKAVKTGLCYYADKNVLVTPAQIDALFIWRGTQAAKSPSPTAAGGRSRGSERALRLLGQRRAEREKKRKNAK
jgi:hypothetical protein